MLAGMAREEEDAVMLQARCWLSSFWKVDLSLLRSSESRRSRDEAKVLYLA